MITHAEWDSSHFGFKIGQINDVKWQLGHNYNELIEQAEGFDCVYIFSQTPLPSALINKFPLGKIYFVDHKAQLKKNGIIEGLNTGSDFNIIQVSEPDPYFEQSIDSLIKYSRFYKDAGFSNERIQAMYRVWLDKCKAHGKTYVAMGPGGAYLGMVGYIIDGSKASLNQIVISPEARGKKVGRSLVAHAEQELSRMGILEFRVDTQMWNKAALELYFSQGYFLHFQTLVYHWWIRKG